MLHAAISGWNLYVVINLGYIHLSRKSTGKLQGFEIGLSRKFRGKLQVFSPLQRQKVGTSDFPSEQRAASDELPLPRNSRNSSGK